MAEKIVEFLIRLSKDPAAMDAYLRDPDRALTGTDLTADERAVVRSGDAGAISRHLGLEGFFAQSQKSQISPPPPPEKKGPPPPPPKTPPPPKPPKSSAANV
jgi:hypothetical protein